MENLPWAERRQGPQFLVCCPGITEELRSWVPGWLVWLPLTQAAPHPAPTLPSLPGTPALLCWPTPKGKKMNNDYHKKNERAHKPKQFVQASSPTAHCPEPTAGWSTSPQDPSSQGSAVPPSGRGSHSSAPSLTQGSPWHRQRLAMVPPGASEALASLSCSSCH